MASCDLGRLPPGSSDLKTVCSLDLSISSVTPGESVRKAHSLRPCSATSRCLPKPMRPIPPSLAVNPCIFPRSKNRQSTQHGGLAEGTGTPRKESPLPSPLGLDGPRADEPTRSDCLFGVDSVPCGRADDDAFQNPAKCDKPQLLSVVTCGRRDDQRSARTEGRRECHPSGKGQQEADPRLERDSV